LRPRSVVEQFVGTARWRPEDAAGGAVHKRLETLRNKTYAHTDADGKRVASATLVVTDAGELEHGAVVEQWTSLDRRQLEAIIELQSLDGDPLVDLYGVEP
jgi:hypothetical protein